MDRGLVVATQLSTLSPSSQSVISVPIQTSVRNAPLPSPPKESDPPPEHALYSSVLDTQAIGPILLRVIHAGLILELAPVSVTNASLTRFVFPARIVSSPAILLWESQQAHVLVVTELGSLYRLVLPITIDGQFWNDQVSNNWCREYLIKNVSNPFEGIVQVQGTHCVVLSLPGGALLRVDTERLGDDTHDDEWTESVFQHSSFLTSLTSFLPTLHGGNPNGAEIVSMASHPQPTDIGDIWTLSRDRTLRVWTAKNGCVSAKSLPTAVKGRDPSPALGSSSSGGKPKLLLESEKQTLLRSFTLDNQDYPYVLAFIPSHSSSSSAGFFQLFSTIADQLYEICSIEASHNTAHCYLQDFMVYNNVLYTLWDKQGQTVIEKMGFDGRELKGLIFGTGIWKAATYGQEPELTPGYLDELLLSSGSLTDKYLEAIMRPGVFSSLTLRTALDQYIDACLSIPGPTPTPLTTTYATLAENIAAVVGCTVSLNRDPQTGALQHVNYWNALKRDWEGFIARCREVERSARWPLVLGVDETRDMVVVVERERMGILVAEDLPLRLHRLLVAAFPLEPQFALLDIVWTLHSKLGQPLLLNLESRLVEMIHQEIAFSYADIIQDEARQFNFKGNLEDGMESWIIGRLSSIEDLDQATRIILDVVAGFDPEVKQEEDDSNMEHSPSRPAWIQGLTTAYVSTSVHARYDLCLSLIMLLFFLSDQLPLWDPSLLAEIFAVFRGIAMLRYVARQPVGDINDTKSGNEDSVSPDDVVAHMRNMQVSQNRARFTPTYSLIQRLLSQRSDVQGLVPAAHHFLDETGLLQSVSPAHVTKYEVLFCERVRLLGYFDVARELLAWLPRTPGVTYVLSRLWLSIGRDDDSAYLLEKLAGSFSADDALLFEDQEALAGVLPGAQIFDSEFSFYLHASSLFKSSSIVRHDVSFSQLALSVAPTGMDTSALWQSVISGYTYLGLYDDAYAALISTPYIKLKRDCISQLVYRMCEENAVEQLMTFNFAGYTDEVEDALSFKARNADPRIHPHYSKILYTWYTFRGDHRNAALTMYQRAQKLHALLNGPQDGLSLAEDQLTAYLLSANSLSLIDRKSAWIVLPVTSEGTYEPRKRRKLSKYIPEAKYAPGKFVTEVVELADIQYDFALLSARLSLVKHDPTLLSSGGLLLSPPSVILRMVQSNKFDSALATARSLQVDMTDLFAHLTGQCLRLSRNPEGVLQEDTSDWLLTDKVSSWPGTPADRGWRYLRQALERHDGTTTDFKYSKVVLETIYGFDRSFPPPWLIKSLEEYHHEYLIRTSLRYDLLDNALEYTLSLIKKTDTRISRDLPKSASSTWLPYHLIDEVLAASEAEDHISEQGQRIQQELRKELSNHVKRMQKLSQSSR